MLSPITSGKAHRQTAHLAAMGDAEINRRLEALATSFGKDWLEADGGHPLQKLWARGDALATNQLVLVGDAIFLLTATNGKWVADQVRDIKQGNDNARRGAMFELLALSMLKAPTVVPTPRNHPGYDAVLVMADNASLLVSLKSYGKSVHEQSFEAECETTERVFTQALTTLKVSGLSLRVVAKIYPRANHWQALRQAIPSILAQPNHVREALHPIGDTWAIAIGGVPTEVLPLSDKHLSYQVVFLAPFHQNESKNLTDKLDAAAANARKHAGATSEKDARAVLVRLPETISLKVCSEWAQHYVAEHPNGPLDLVLLYQPTVADTADGRTVIDHAFVSCQTSTYATWMRPGRNFGIEVLVGQISNGTSRRLVVDGTVPDAPEIDEMYLYQRGEFYTVFEQKPNGTAEGHLDNLASGIVRHAVFRMASGDEAVLSGVFPAKKALSLFD
jgi:hypothetical protein